MKRFSWLLLAGLLAACSSKDASQEGATEKDASRTTGVDAFEATVADAGSTVFSCPATMPGMGTACTREEAICEYSSTLSCPVGCSGGDFHGYQCRKGRWEDYRHAAGAPQCRCTALDFPKGMQGTWRFNEVGSPEPYAWVRFSALGDTISGGTPGQGTIDVLAGSESATGSLPWWLCNGQGHWYLTQRPETFQVSRPTTCPSTSTIEIHTLTSRESAIPASLPACLLHITMDSISGAQIEACKYPDTQCDAAMKTCQARP